MKSPNSLRIMLCGLVAGVMWYLLSVTFLAILAPRFVTSVQRTAPNPAQRGEVFFAIDLLMGVWAVWLYSAIAPTYGANLTSAARCSSSEAMPMAPVGMVPSAPRAMAIKWSA